MSILLYVLSVFSALTGIGLLYRGLSAETVVGGNIANIQLLFEQQDLVMLGIGSLILSGCLLAGGAVTEAITKRRD